MTIQFHRLRPQKETRAGMSRRMFLMTSTMAGITTGSMMAKVSLAATSVLSEPQSAQLLQMVQDIYPHPDLLSLDHYKTIAATVTDNAAKDVAVAQTLTDGLARIDAQAVALFGTAYVNIVDPDAREGVLRHFEAEGFFQSVRWTAYFAIYDNKDVWPLFGYEGSSVEHGGYIDRGFSDITFVPEGPTLDQRLAEVQG